MSALQITKDLLKPWSPCADGWRWFLAKFPQGGEYGQVQKALREDKRHDYARWLTDHVWNEFILHKPAITADVTADHKAEALEIIASTTALRVVAPDGDKHSAQIGSSGDSARIGATGEHAVIACAGLNNRAKAGANGVLALAWYDDAARRTRIAVGYVGEGLKADTWYEVNGGEFVEVQP